MQGRGVPEANCGDELARGDEDEEDKAQISCGEKIQTERKKSLYLNVGSDVSASRVARTADTSEHFTDEMARGETANEADKHAGDDGDEDLVDCAGAFYLEVVGGP